MPLATLDWTVVRQHYDDRKSVHRRLLKLHPGKQTRPFVDLALGISDPNGNYSAAEHNIGPKILASNASAPKRVLDLASKFLGVKRGDARLTVEIEVAAQVAPRGFSGLQRQGAANGERCQEG